MLNYLWGAMIVIGIIIGAITGRISEVGNACITSAKEAVSLCITMLGVMSLWTGLMQVAKKAGIIESLTKLLNPIICFLFPRIPKEHKAKEYIAANMIANILGLGWAATPPGLQAMESLSELEKERGNPQYIEPSSKGVRRIASNEMCTFLIINISSLQLIPVNIIAYRSQYGSVNPAAIVAPAIIATTVSTIVGAIYCKMMDRNH